MSLSIGTSTLLCAGAVGFVLLYRWVHENGIPMIGLGPHRVKLPGPPGLPFVGNLFELREGHAKALGRWTKKYGGMFRIAVGEREVVMLSSYNSVSESLVQQGQAFQSRPEFKLWHGVFLKAVEDDAPSTIGTSPMDDRINMFRRHLTAQTASVRQRRYNHFISRRMYRFVNLLAETAKSGKAEDLGFHMWTTTTGLSTEMLFGAHYDEAIIRKISEVELLIFRQRSLGQPVHDYVKAVDLYEKFLMATAKPLHAVYNAFGLAEGIEKFNSAEENARRLRDIEAGYCKQLGRELHERCEQGDLTPSQLGDLIRIYGMQLTTKDEFRVATSLVGSGMGIGTLMAWLAPKLAATPAVQEKAYNAIKAVYGNEYPDMYDTDRVEYIKALGLEVGRYYASARLGFSRETVQDVEINGHKIPAGTLVMLNSYWINHDPERYDDPDEFIPERWMDGHYGRLDGKAVKMGVPHLNHGAGRRYCVGIPYVNKIIYAAILLLTYNFRLERGTLDSEGMEKVFPSFRQKREMTGEVNAIEDQASEYDPQAIPLAAGIKVSARDPEGLARWLAEAPTLLDQFDEPDLSVKAAGES